MLPFEVRDGGRSDMSTGRIRLTVSSRCSAVKWNPQSSGHPLDQKLDASTYVEDYVWLAARDVVQLRHHASSLVEEGASGEYDAEFEEQSRCVAWDSAQGAGCACSMLSCVSGALLSSPRSLCGCLL